ncbi:MAG: sialate O-acetylesterase [Bacteroidia bacterium]|nr:sialate O-acetylesterase [Bacteroidia bacterium]
MVLQQQSDASIWGTYTPEGTVNITAGWGKPITTKADSGGNWQLKLATPEAGGPYDITISTVDTTILIKDVLVGEVWLASGQSNMEMPIEGFTNEPIDNYEEELADAKYPEIRQFNISRAISPTPLSEVNGEWQVTNPESAKTFSASAYFFARKLHDELKVPIGIINSTWGGTPVESWISHDKIRALDEFREVMETLKPEKIEVFESWFANFPQVPIPKSSEDWEALDLDDNEIARSDFDDASWSSLNLPGMVENGDVLGTDGVFWVRKKVMIEDIGTDYQFVVSQGIDDMDVTYVNGQKIGFTLCWNCPRSYDIPKSVLKQGENVLAMRIIDTGGPGGCSGEMKLTNQKGTTIPIDGEWSFKQIADIKGSQFLMYEEDSEAFKNPPAGIEKYQIDPRTPGVLYNAMIHPIIPFEIKGAIWYQGESNVGRAEQYLKLFPGMIDDWRTRWQKSFPFHFVQIAPFDYGNGLSPALRDAQRKSLVTEKTGMAITMDIGHPTSIHPGNKQDVGDRLARLALSNDYGIDMVASGPIYKSHSISGNKITIEFDHSNLGVVSGAGGLSGFEIAGSDKNFIQAKANIVGDKIEVRASSIADPQYVRYGWKDYIKGSLFNKDGLPASSFTTE